MELLYYNDLDYKKVAKQFSRVAEQLAKSNFSAAEVKKMPDHGFYRAKLDYENRLLFKIGKHNNKTYLLLLEVIYNHEYNKSRFLRGAAIDESKLLAIEKPDLIDVSDLQPLSYVNPANKKFHLLDKAISFDAMQEEIFNLRPPLIIIGSAGSGKTVLTLEKLKTLKGRVLYVTLSSFLVDNSSTLYYSQQYQNENQEIDFLSFADFCSTIKFLEGKEMNQRAFELWMQTRAHIFGIKDVHKLFEEFRGVITGMDIEKPFLSRSDYLNLGVKQSIFLGSEREKVYDAFEKYLEFLSENGFFDYNIVAHSLIPICQQTYDFVVVDEVQDFTNIQLYLILKSLKEKGSFILCGDSNQIVHPNYFSWSNVKTMFFKHDIGDREFRFLRTNYRNSGEITNIANCLLKIKNARFGSVDKESTYLMNSLNTGLGEVALLNDKEKTLRMLNQKTSRSTRYAVIVMRQEDKSFARRFFNTPLLFSIHESKGLEYDNVILLNFVSNYRENFHDITQHVSENHIDSEEMVFSRGRDKTDKSLDAYKFYINSLYVAITRGIKNVYMVESNHNHRILFLLKLAEKKEDVKIEESISSREEWKREAEKLEKQGKKEHADDIRKAFFADEKPGWVPLTPDAYIKLRDGALDENHFNKKAKDKVFAYALIYGDKDVITRLSWLKYRKADNPEKEYIEIIRKYYNPYRNNDLKQIGKLIEKYGVNYRDEFNLTPLLAAIVTNCSPAIPFLLEKGADITLTDNIGKNALRLVMLRLFKEQKQNSVADMIFARFKYDTLRLKLDDKLIIIPSSKFEYILLNFFIAVQKNNPDAMHAFTPGDVGLKARIIELSLEIYPETIVPDYRKKKTYISAMLSKNEEKSNNPYSNRIFTRMTRGEYVMNPRLEMFVNEKWINIYDMLELAKPFSFNREDEFRNHMELITQLEPVKKFMAQQQLKDEEKNFMKKAIDNIMAQNRMKQLSKQNLKAKQDQKTPVIDIKKQNEPKQSKPIKKDIPDNPNQTKLDF